MTETLFSLSLDVCRKLGMVREGTATGGGTSTIIDTVFRTEESDYWNLGTAWITDTTDGLAPKGELKEISDFDNASATITLRSVVTAAVGAGDSYAAGKTRYPYWVLKQKINEALVAMGTIPIVDKSSITTAAAQTEYSLPIAANYDLRTVSIQTKLNDTNDYQWVPISGWSIERTAVATADLLILPSQPPTGRLLKLEYVGVHDELDAASDSLSETVHKQRVVVEAAFRCLLWRKQKIGDMDPTIDIQMNLFMDERNYWLSEGNIPKPRKEPVYLTYGGYVEKDDFTWPS